MAKKLRYHPLVAVDLSTSIDWYDGCSLGLGSRFAQSVKNRLDDVQSKPEIFPLAFEDLELQFARIRRFPYLVLFQVEGQFIYVAGVFHSASDPEKWRNRVKGQ